MKTMTERFFEAVDSADMIKVGSDYLSDWSVTIIGKKRMFVGTIVTKSYGRIRKAVTEDDLTTAELTGSNSIRVNENNIQFYKTIKIDI